MFKRIIAVVILLSAFFITINTLSRSVTQPYLEGRDNITDITRRRLSGSAVTSEEIQTASAPNLNIPVTAEKDTGYILIGDSRSLGMDVFCEINETPDGFFVVAAAGEGFRYMMDTALPCAELIEQAYPDIHHWIYIINMGVNDYWQRADCCEIYRTALTELAYKKDLYIVSVNPVRQDAELEQHGLSNKGIEELNSTLKSIPNTHYIDTYSYLMENGYKTLDNFHYTWDITGSIYRLIKAGL
jgi:hypothetical protein